MRRRCFTGVCGHLVNARALVLKLLLKAIDLALKAQYVLLLGSQGVVQRLYRVLNERDLRFQRCFIPHWLTSKVDDLRVLV